MDAVGLREAWPKESPKEAVELRLLVLPVEALPQADVSRPDRERD